MALQFWHLTLLSCSDFTFLGVAVWASSLLLVLRFLILTPGQWSDRPGYVCVLLALQRIFLQSESECLNESTAVVCMRIHTNEPTLMNPH